MTQSGVESKVKVTWTVIVRPPRWAVAACEKAQHLQLQRCPAVQTVSSYAGFAKLIYDGSENSLAPAGATIHQ